MRSAVEAVTNARECVVVGAAGGVESLLDALHRHDDGDVEMVHMLLSALERLARTRASAGLIASSGGVEKALGMLERYSGEADVIIAACLLLRRLANYDECRKQIEAVGLGGQELLSRLTQEYRSGAEHMCPRANVLAQYLTIVNDACYCLA